MQNIDRSQLEKMNDMGRDDFVLINVLPQKEFNKEHIRTSINIPHDEENFTSSVAKVCGTRDREVVVYCASFDCDASTKAAEKLDAAGFSKVFDYEGGTKDWMENHRH